MAEGVRFGYAASEAEPRVFIELQPEIARSFLADEGSAALDALAIIATKKVAAVEVAPVPDSEATRIYVNAAQIGAEKDAKHRDAILKRLGTFINGIQDYGTDPNLWMSWGTHKEEDGYYETLISFNWPDGVSTEVLWEASTEVLDVLATDVGLTVPHGVTESPTWANVSRETGVSLLIGDSRVRTDVGLGAYEPTETWVEMTGHYINDQRQQLVGLAGTIVLAYPGDLLQTGV